MGSNLVRLPQPIGPDPVSIEDVEISLLLEGVFRLFGYDFRQYSPTSVKRRLKEMVAVDHLDSISSLQERVFRDPDMLNRLVSSMSIQASHLFRDPKFFLAFRRKAVPLLRTYPLIRIWHAGCANGEEVYSMAILLKEEDLLNKSLLYATDINVEALQIALHGAYSTQHIEACERNYKEAGGRASLASYFEREGRKSRITKDLRDHIVFTRHNLVTDGSFNEFNVILCRNVLLYFTQELRNRVHALLHGSLMRFGLLALGAQETIRFTTFEKQYRPLDEENNLYRRVN